MTDMGFTLNALANLNVGEGPQEVRERKEAAVNMFTLTEEIALLEGSGPEETEERRLARMTDMGFTLNALANLNVGQGPQEVRERKEAAVNLSSLSEGIALLDGSGPVETEERRLARMTDMGETKSAFSHLHFGDGPSEVFEHRAAIATTKSGLFSLKGALAQLEGSGPEESEERRA